MQQATQQKKSSYVVLPRTVWEKRTQKVAPTLNMLRKAVSRAWKGHGAVDEIRTQRTK